MRRVSWAAVTAAGLVVLAIVGMGIDDEDYVRRALVVAVCAVAVALLALRER